MAFRIHRSEPAAAALQRLLLEQNRKALKLLHSWEEDPAEHIHRSRQCFKKTRAVLRLLRPVAPYIFEVEDRFYRGVGRQLSDVRDADALVEAIGFLGGQFDAPTARNSLAMLENGLRRRAPADAGSTAVVADRCAKVAEALESADRRFHHLPLRDVKRKHVRRSARRGLRRCAKAFREARRSGRAEDFHAWRKHVKRSYYHARLMRDLAPGWSRAHAASLKQLEVVLGHRQDLYVLDRLLAAQPDELGIDLHVRRIRGMIEVARAGLETRAFDIGNKVFEAAQASAPGNLVSLRARGAL